MSDDRIIQWYEYLKDLNEIEKRNYKIIAFKGVDGIVTSRIKNSLISYCQKNKLEIINFKESLQKSVEEVSELIEIAQNIIKIPRDNFVI